MVRETTGIKVIGLYPFIHLYTCSASLKVFVQKSTLLIVKKGRILKKSSFSLNPFCPGYQGLFQYLGLYLYTCCHSNKN